MWGFGHPGARGLSIRLCLQGWTPCGCHTMVLQGDKGHGKVTRLGRSSCLGSGCGGEAGSEDWAKQQQGCWQPQ